MEEARAYFCMCCGGTTSPMPVEGTVRDVCGVCGWIYYRNPVPAAGTAVVQEGKILLVQRRFPPRAGAWCLPVGFQEYDESLEEAAQRETYEETGLEVEVGELLHHFFNRGYDMPHANIFLYRAQVLGGDMAQGSDALDVGWFAYDQLPDPIAFINHREVIDQVLGKEQD